MLDLCLCRSPGISSDRFLFSPGDVDRGSSRLGHLSMLEEAEAV